jgi:intracellular multiplication protein IcmK
MNQTMKTKSLILLASLAGVSLIGGFAAQAQTTNQPSYVAPSPYVAGATPNGRPAPSAPMPSPSGAVQSPALDKVQTAIDQSVPLNPEELKQLLTALTERQRAARQNVTGMPPTKPVTSVETLDLSPGATPPVIRLSVGEAATLSFADAAGRPWEIADNLNANGRAYDARLIAPHLYNITLKTRESANITLVLKGLPRPVVITVLPAGAETDYLKEYTIPKFLGGEPPAAVAASSKEGALSFNSPELINYLYRTPPKSARALKVDGLPGVIAWQIANNKMVVRTAGQVVIPAFSRRHAATDGVAVFEVPLSPVVSITEGGALHRVSISGYTVDTITTASSVPASTSITLAPLPIPTPTPAPIAKTTSTASTSTAAPMLANQQPAAQNTGVATAKTTSAIVLAK